MDMCVIGNDKIKMYVCYVCEKSFNQFICDIFYVCFFDIFCSLSFFPFGCHHHHIHIHFECLEYSLGYFVEHRFIYMYETLCLQILFQ